MSSSLAGFRLVEAGSAWAGVEGLWDVVNVAYGHATDWRLEIALEHPLGAAARLVFDDPASFRVQDEGDMLDYWAARDREGVAVGLLYRVETSAYRAGFATSISAQVQALTHYLICGRDVCVEALSAAPPRLDTA